MWAAMCYAGLATKVRSKLGLCAKPATPPTPLPQPRKINCTLQNAVVEKAAWWAARCYAGLALKAYIEPATFRSSPTVAMMPQLRIRTSAKSIAACRMHLQKKVHGVLRCEKRGWCPKS